MVVVTLNPSYKVFTKSLPERLNWISECFAHISYCEEVEEMGYATYLKKTRKEKSKCCMQITEKALIGGSEVLKIWKTQKTILQQ